MKKRELTKIASLAEAVKKKDKDAFVELYTMTYQKTFFLALMIVKDRYLAEDVVQEVYISVLQEIHKLQNNITFIAWLNKITYRMSLQQLARQKEIPVERSWQSETAAASQGDVAERVVARADNEYLIGKIRELPRDLRAVIVLKYYEEMKLEEIAEILECPVGTVKSRLYHAKKRLREKLSLVKAFSLLLIPAFLSGRKSLVTYAAVTGMGESGSVGVLNICLRSGGLEKEGLITALHSSAGGGLSSWMTAGAGVILAASLGSAVFTAAAPVIEVSGWNNEPTNRAASVAIGVHGRLPISEVRVLTPSGESLDCQKDSDGIYRLELVQNGEYEITAWDFRGKESSRTFLISGIDRQSPDMEAYSYDFETSLFTAVISDDSSGVDFESSYIMTEKGEKIKADSPNEKSGRMTFYTTETVFDFYLLDCVGNRKKYHIYTAEK